MDQMRERGTRGRGRGRGAEERREGEGVTGRNRRIGRGRGNYIRPNQDFPPGQQQSQRTQPCNNNYYSRDNAFFPSQLASTPRTVMNSQHELHQMSEQGNKTRTLHPEELGIELKQKSPIASLLPRKPEKLGNFGKRIRVVSNCFSIKIPSGYVFHYDVNIKKRAVHAEPQSKCVDDDSNNSEFEAKDIADECKKYKCLNTRTNRKVISLLVDTEEIFNGLYPAYDGKKNLYTKKELQADFPFKRKIRDIFNDFHQISEEFMQDVYEVELKPVKKLDTETCAINLDSINAFFDGKTDCIPEEAIMAVETILRHTPCLRLTPIGRSFYYSLTPDYSKPIGNGIEIWFGYHQSVRLGQWKPTVNLDTAATTFLSKGPVIKFIADAVCKSVEGLRRMPFIDENDIKKISCQLNNKEIRETHSSYGRKYRIVKLDNVSANEKLLKDSELTVSDYFKRKYGIDLKYPNLPCLQVKPEKREVFLPLEVCEFTPGQHYKTELTQSQKANMIKFTTFSPVDRFKKIDNIVKTAKFSSDKCAREFNLEVSTTPLKLEARELDPPNLIYADEKRVTPKNGSWVMKSVKFLEGGKISKWLLVSFRHHDNLKKFAKLLVTNGREMGININSSYEMRLINEKVNVHTFLSEAKEKFDLVIIVIPILKAKERTRIYASFKTAAETLIGLKTQCIKEERLDDMNDKRGIQIIRNLCLKINAKIGGENYCLIPREMPEIFQKPVIIIGADVSHPSPVDIAELKKQNSIHPSIAACVGSLDNFGKRFAATVRPQLKTENGKNKTEEIIRDLQKMTVEILKAFYRHTNKKPEKIIFYRDGVSEGQFESVKNCEVASIRKACKTLQDSDYEPGITFIVMQKRHNVRFKTDDPRDGIGGDLREGTVADTVVTHPLNFDFFLKSQAGNRGTSRPSYYTVIEDDNDFSANDLQRMTYNFCYMYARCTKSISVPAPVAYAHLVAYRARKYYYDKMRDKSSNVGAESSIPTPTLYDIYKKIEVLDDLKDSMYFV